MKKPIPKILEKILRIIAGIIMLAFISFLNYHNLSA